jgi:predicted nucleotidyltransferase component of viral defense system
LFFSANNTLKGSIDGVQVDILAHRYSYVRSPQMIENITMVSVEDIIAMKLNAISISGQRIKDFIDIFYLLKSYTIEDMIHFYKTKYATFNEVNVLKSLTWFEDIDHSVMPVLLENPKLKWSEVSKKIRQETQKYVQKEVRGER